MNAPLPKATDTINTTPAPIVYHHDTILLSDVHERALSDRLLEVYHGGSYETFSGFLKGCGDDVAQGMIRDGEIVPLHKLQTPPAPETPSPSYAELFEQRDNLLSSLYELCREVTALQKSTTAKLPAPAPALPSPDEWALVKCCPLDWNQDDSGVYTTIHGQEFGFVRLDLMTTDSLPLQSFEGGPMNVHKHLARYLDSKGITLSIEHALYIGQELQRAATVGPAFIQD